MLPFIEKDTRDSIDQIQVLTQPPPDKEQKISIELKLWCKAYQRGVRLCDGVCVYKK